MCEQLLEEKVALPQKINISRNLARKSGNDGGMRLTNLSANKLESLERRLLFKGTGKCPRQTKAGGEFTFEKQ